MTPSHAEGLAAAKRIHAANEEGVMGDARDAILMLTYHLSLELRRLPEQGRMAEALRIGRVIAANTRESLD
jgi:hypothetical protein